MKSTFALLITLVTMGLFAFTAPVDTLYVNTKESTVNWKGYKVTGSHEGTIPVSKGELQLEAGRLIGGSFTIDVAGLKVTDLQGAVAGKLEGHLKSPDFFGTEEFPQAEFVITKVSSRGTEGSYRVTGDITIKGTTKEIKFNTQLTEEMGKTIATADLELDRTDFGLRYGSGSFVENLGDKTIYDEFELQIRLVANK